MGEIMRLPVGYTVVEKKDDMIAIAMGWQHFNEDAEPFVYYEGEKYKRGPLTLIPLALASSACSCREYYKVK
jgi:hypothetical protein